MERPMLEDRRKLLETELRAHGVRDAGVMAAMKNVPRQEFVPDELREFAWRNTALPIESGQTISQPSMVAVMCQALELSPRDRVLEIGTGSGYAAAILSRLAAEVFTVERHWDLAQAAAERLKRLGYLNVHIRHADGTRGWPEQAPFDAIVVAAGGPGVPKPLLEQLAGGGRLVIPVGSTRDSQKLLRITRRGVDRYDREWLGDVAFVPLIGEAGWQDDVPLAPTPDVPVDGREAGVIDAIRRAAEPFGDPDELDAARLLERIGDARIVLIGEASHGTSEFYRVRAAITKALIAAGRCDFVAVEADWPDAMRIHRYVTNRRLAEPPLRDAFARFPTWMWRNHETQDFIHWLRDVNAEGRTNQPIGFYGLDLYSLSASIEAVLDYLDKVDPTAAGVARRRYGCLTPWENDPAMYGLAARSPGFATCEPQVVSMLTEMLGRRVETSHADHEELFDARVNARLVADAERYYRLMYAGGAASWNWRDTHMFETLRELLDRHGSASRGVVWAHNSHLGDATATQFAREGQHNIGQLCRELFGDEMYAIGQGTDSGTVAAASDWDGPLEIKSVAPAHVDSYERLMHRAELGAFLLPLGRRVATRLTEVLTPVRLERAIGVIYRPDTERWSHYFEASLPRQFDEWIWFDRSTAVRPLGPGAVAGHESEHPFALRDT
ncbi:MAG TPA: protein-L-isoaspartate(D-aspartate) O-methyltransferase [Candidatus Eisenbacteria bacterium]